MVHFVALERLVDHFLTLKNNSINFLVLIFVLSMVIKLEIGFMPKIQSFHSNNVVVVNKGFSVLKVSLICSTWKFRNIFENLNLLCNFIPCHEINIWTVYISLLHLRVCINWKMLVACSCRLTFLLSKHVMIFPTWKSRDLFIKSIAYHASTLVPLPNHVEEISILLVVLEIWPMIGFLSSCCKNLS